MGKQFFLSPLSPGVCSEYQTLLCVSSSYLSLLFLQDPEPLPYLQHHDAYTFNINLFVSLKGTHPITGNGFTKYFYS